MGRGPRESEEGGVTRVGKKIAAELCAARQPQPARVTGAGRSELERHPRIYEGGGRRRRGGDEGGGGSRGGRQGV